MKILVISSNLIGDTILSTGVIKHFLEKYSQSKFTIIVGPTSGQIYENFPNLEKIIVIKKIRFSLHWYKIWRKCFLNRWDIIIDFRSSLLSYFLLHKKKYIFKKNYKEHQLEQLKNFFKFKDMPFPYIFNNHNELKKAEINTNKNFNYVLICPGGNWKPKIWEVVKFNKLIKKLHNLYPNIIFIFVGSHKEKLEYFEEVSKDINEKYFIDIMGESLTMTYAYMKKSNLFIGNDSGLMHLASASGVFTIGLFGPTNDKIYAPFGKNCFVLRTKETYDEFLKINIDKNKNYMNSITVNDVLELIQKNKLL